MIYSIGHSIKNIKSFISKLQEFSIDTLVDIRTYPSSRYNPQFNRCNLENVLPKSNIKYLYRGKSLGGLGVNIRYDETIKEMCTLSEKENICLMCSEGDPLKCHRAQTIEPSVNELGYTMKHILWETTPGKPVQVDPEPVKPENEQQKLF